MCIMWLYILSVALKHLAMATVNFELRTQPRAYIYDYGALLNLIFAPLSIG